jgi:DNA-binding winged helix-turn-helix (wHTH) protein
MKSSLPVSSDESDSPAFWREQEILLLQHVMGLIGKSPSPEVVLREVLHLMSELLGLNRGRIVMADETGGSCSIRYAYGLTGDEIDRGCYRVGEGVTGHVLANGQLVIVQDIDHDANFLARAIPRGRLPAGPVSFIALPIRIDDRTVGVLACHRIRSRNRALASDVSILRILATLSGQLLQFQTALREKTHSLEEQNQILVHALEQERARYGFGGTSPASLRAISELGKVSNATASANRSHDLRDGEIALFGPFRLLAAERLLYQGDVPLRLGSRALDVLIVLVERAGEVVSKRDLIARVWPDVVVDDSSLRVQLVGLRKALGDGQAGARYVANVPGRGYCFVAPVSRAATPGQLPAITEHPVAVSELVSDRDTQLPAQLTRMVGREDAVRTISSRLAGQRFVSIVGPGGMGKTTVAVSVSHAFVAEFEGPACFVDLGALTTPELVAATIASALGVVVLDSVKQHGRSGRVARGNCPLRLSQIRT